MCLAHAPGQDTPSRCLNWKEFCVLTWAKSDKITSRPVQAVMVHRGKLTDASSYQHLEPVQLLLICLFQGIQHCLR